ncbi:LTA synthase family protein [Helicobacter bilis]|uniref:LTA synthase family protein n=1 Tax=Helicobacter bilis TaxID=37372 RepID=UPI001F377FAA|nr:alkaline phosphatase family protein [Helicobacter bilis]
MTNTTTKTLSYTTLFQTLLFIIILLIICSSARAIMVAHFIPEELFTHKDFYAMWIMGFKLDMRSIGIAMLVFVGLKLIAFIIESILKISVKLSGGRGVTSRVFVALNSFFSSFSRFFFSFYAFLLGFIFMVAAFVNFYYFQTYGNKIDIFIFGLKDDDTLAILSIMWHDYPLVWGILMSLLCGIITLFAYKIPLKYNTIKERLNTAFNAIKLFIYGVIHLCLIILLIIAARGTLGTFPIKADNFHISTLPIFNHIATNPLMAFEWALKDYRNNATFEEPNIERGKELQERLFPLFHTTADSNFLKDNPPHVVLNVMESFGINALVHDRKDTNDLLGSLRKHFESDFVFYRFLSAADGTAPSFVALFFESPNEQITLGSYKNIKLPYNPFSIYADSGYEVFYITSGYGQWQGLEDYTKTQGAHKVYDALTLMEKYPESKQDSNSWGVPDEYVYRLAFEILSSATKPTFIAILTTSNHPPHLLPHTFSPMPLSFPSELADKLTQKEQDNLVLPIKLYQYANNAFGDFMDRIKQSNLAKNTIISATGDHRLRNLGPNPNTDKALNFSVPFYIYIPQAYQINLHYNPSRVGSHKDILPTLYALSLSNATYMSVGGRNMLGKVDNKQYEFGFNRSVWIDDNGIYPTQAGVGYLWKDKEINTDSKKAFGLHALDESFLLQDNKDFENLYRELFNYSISWRIYNAK